MVSAPPGRSATVTSLSGRVNALKFMQRASPSFPTNSTTNNTSTKPTGTPSNAASSSHTPLASPSPASSAPGSPAPFNTASEGASEEQWSLSPAAIVKLRAKAVQHGKQAKKENAGPEISQEAGFDAWLITRNKEEGKVGNRQTFGKLGKQKEDDESEEQEEGKGKKKRSRTAEDSEALEPDFESASNSSQAEEPKGFIKPGSFKGGSRKQQSSSPKKAKTSNKEGGKKKDQDKVVFARKRGGKPGISGGSR